MIHLIVNIDVGLLAVEVLRIGLLVIAIFQIDRVQVGFLQIGFVGEVGSVRGRGAFALREAGVVVDRPTTIVVQGLYSLHVRQIWRININRASRTWAS